MMRPANHSNNKSLDGNRASGGNSNNSPDVNSACTPPSAASMMMDHFKSQVFSSFMIQKQKISERLFTPIPSKGGHNNSTTGHHPGLTHSQSSPPFGFIFVLKSSDPLLESRIQSLKNSRAKHKQLKWIVQKQIMSSLDVLSQSFSSLSLLMNELSSATLDFSNINMSGGQNEIINSTPAEKRGGKTSNVDGDEDDVHITSDDDSDSDTCGKRAFLSSGNLIESKSDLMSSYKELAVKLKFLSSETNKAMIGFEFFESNLSTLIDKSMRDSFDTIHVMEDHRIKFDAERSNLYLRQQQQLSHQSLVSGHHSHLAPAIQQQQSSSSSGTLNPSLLTESESAKLSCLESKYLKLKDDVSVKLNFLSFNQQKVMRKEISLFNSLIFGLFKDPSASITSSMMTGCSHHHHHHNQNSSSHPSNISILDSVLKAYSIHPHQSSSSRHSSTGPTTSSNTK